MPMLRLILDPEGTPVNVDDAMLMGAYAAQLAAQFDYPLSDSSGKPLLYQLCLSTDGRLLPNNQRFRDFQLASGTRLTLASAAASATSPPMESAGLP